MKKIINDKGGAKPSLEIVEPAIDGDVSPPSLIDYLKALPSGPVLNAVPVTRLLAAAWSELDGSDEGGMKGYKLHGERCENLAWNTPLLTFIIARHGAMAFGSSRAELQHWSVDPFEGKAWISKIGKRQAQSMSKRFDVDALAEKIADEIERKSESSKLKWNPDGSVKVVVGEVVPKTYARKTADQRRRFHLALIDAM